MAATAARVSSYHRCVSLMTAKRIVSRPAQATFDLFDVTAVDVAFAVETRVVGVILDDVAPDGQPHDSGCGDEGCP